MSTAIVREAAAAIVELSRELAAITPAPRTEPHFGMDHPSGSRLSALDDLAVRGIFRKYELVLELGARLGAASRWLAARFGCEAVGLVGSDDDAAANALLTRRSPVAHAVRVVVGSHHRMPFRDGAFTHAWSIESLSAFEDPDAVLRETFRVVRPGGWVAVQELIATEPSIHDAVTWRRNGDDLRHVVTAAGFLDAELRDATATAVHEAASASTARQLLHRHLRTRGEAFEALVASRERVTEALRTGRLRVVQLVARLPA